MPRTEETRPSVHESLERVTELLRKHELVEGSAQQPGPRQELVENLVHRLHLVELRKVLETLHPADVAHVLESLPLERRLIVWELVRGERSGEILLEVSDAVRETLIAHMDEDELVAATEQLDTDEIADLAPDLPREVIQDVFMSRSPQEREQLRAALSYPEDTVGALMDFDLISIREEVTLEGVLRYLRQLDEMPDHTDQLFVADRGGRLKGLLRVDRLLVTDPETPVQSVMLPVSSETDAAVRASLEPYVTEMIKKDPTLTREYFSVQSLGLSHLGIGSARVQKYLVRTRGATDSPDDDEIPF